MAMNYTSLVADKSTAGSIRRWINYDLLDSDAILEEAQTWIYDRLRVREMMMSGTIAALAGVQFANLPSGFLDPIDDFRDLSDNARLIQTVDPEMLRRYRGYSSSTLSTGRVSYVAIYDEKLNFDCKAQSNMSIEALYYGQPALLSGSVLTNFLTTRYPHVLRAVCIEFGNEMYHESEDYVRNMSRSEQMIERANANNEMFRRPQQTPIYEYR